MECVNYLPLDFRGVLDIKNIVNAISDCDHHSTHKKEKTAGLQHKEFCVLLFSCFWYVCEF